MANYLLSPAMAAREAVRLAASLSGWTPAAREDSFAERDIPMGAHLERFSGVEALVAHDCLDGSIIMRVMLGPHMLSLRINLGARMLSLDDLSNEVLAPPLERWVQELGYSWESRWAGALCGSEVC